MLTSILASVLALVTLTTPGEVYASQDAQNEGLTFNNFIQILDFQDAYEQGSSEIHGRNLQQESARSVGTEIWQHLKTSFKGDAEAAFKHYDKDNSGKLENKELHALAADLGYKHQPDKEDDRFVDRVKEKFGGGDDKLTYKEFESTCFGGSVGKEIWTHVENKFKGDAEAAFKHYDKDNSGKLENKELHALAADLGYKHQPDKEDDRFVDRVKEKFGGGDDKLTYKEFESTCFGDPHFITWYGKRFSYHGSCDLVLVHNPYFHFGKGLDLHVRTEHMQNGAFSFVSNVALRIQNDILEVVKDGSYLLNGVKNSSLPANIGRFTVTKAWEKVCNRSKSEICADLITFIIHLADDDKIKIKMASNMLHVSITGQAKNFLGSSGLMGTHPDLRGHGRLGRDGSSIIMDTDTFAREWQVLADEPKLFAESRYPQHPQMCVPAVQPTTAGRNLRSADDLAKIAAAENACAHVNGPNREFCVFDLMATGDYGLAATIYGA